MTITLTNNATYKIVFNVTESKDYLVPYEGPSSLGDNAYKSDAFIIEVKCKAHCIYSVLADGSDIPRRLSEGLPYKVTLEANASKCIQFVSMEQNISTHLLLSTHNVSNVNYSLRCFSRTSWGSCNDDQDLIVRRDGNTEMVNIELRSLEGIYLLCM